MHKLLPTLTIVIPAFNEERNISQLLSDLKAQVVTESELVKVSVISDASTDQTEKKVTAFGWSKVQLKRLNKRSGKPQLTAQFFADCQTDMIVLLDADIKLTDKYFIEKLIAPIVAGQADLTSCRVEELPTRTIVEKAILVSMQWKKSLFEAINHGNMALTCHGRARGFSKRLYKNLLVPQEIVADDAYSFFKCEQLGYTYQYVKNTELWYHLPKNNIDHSKQSTRFFQGQSQLKLYFDKKTVESAYRIPFHLMVVTMLNHFFKQPGYFSFYLVIVFFNKVKSFITPNGSAIWTVATSSKG